MRHREYARTLCQAEEALRKGAVRDDRTLTQLYAARRRRDTEELYRRAVLNESHRLYFSSFAEYPTVSDAFCRRFGGVTTFFGRLLDAAREAERFLYIGTGRRGELLLASDIGVPLRLGRPPRLCVDVCEHAYFTDYGFDRDAYLRAAVAHLDVGRLLCEENAKDG